MARRSLVSPRLPRSAEPGGGQQEPRAWEGRLGGPSASDVCRWVYRSDVQADPGGSARLNQPDQQVSKRLRRGHVGAMSGGELDKPPRRVGSAPWT
jgi:hypothetical protein